jgi:hypothetical protein
VFLRTEPITAETFDVPLLYQIIIIRRLKDNQRRFEFMRVLGGGRGWIGRWRRRNGKKFEDAIENEVLCIFLGLDAVGMM